MAALEATHTGRPGEPSVKDQQAVTRLGAPYEVFAGDISPFRLEVAKRIAAINTDGGLPTDWPVPADERARVRTEVGRESFFAEHGRQPLDAREPPGSSERTRTRSPTCCASSRPTPHTPGPGPTWSVRSTCGVWSGPLSPTATAAPGTPDLHTDVAIANEVQTLGPVCSGAPDCAELDGGRWLAIDGRILFKAVVTVSETYNTALETRLRDDLDVRFQDRVPDALSGATPGPTAAGDSRGGVRGGHRQITSATPH